MDMKTRVALAIGVLAVAAVAIPNRADRGPGALTDEQKAIITLDCAANPDAFRCR